MGQRNDYVCGELLELSKEEIARLIEEKVIQKYQTVSKQGCLNIAGRS